MNIAGRIYYDVATGNKIEYLPEQQNVFGVRETTIEEDIESLTELSKRNRESFDVIQLEIGQYAEEFATSIGFRVNPETKTLEFSVPDPNNPQEPPVYQKPFSEQLLELKEKQVAMNRTVEVQGTSQQDLLELLIDTGVI